MSGLIFEAAENLGYRLGVRLRRERWPNKQRLNKVGAYLMFDIRDDNIWGTLVIEGSSFQIDRIVCWEAPCPS